MENPPIEQAASAILSRQSLCAGGLGQRLLKKNYPQSEVDQVIKSFIARGWLDDRTWAMHRSETLLRRAPISAILLERKLIQEGLDQSQAALFVSELLPTCEEADRLRSRAKQLLGDQYDDPSHIGRIGRRLSREGWTADEIQSVLEELPMATDWDSQA
ncbi:MAG: hypothetical protein CMJ32_06945 [Phycisphaerae bacterium]|nr:hypothetical protein [Phycisphaerae bacterium]